jgi:hydroxymethylpyrimidine/phosphomethylpyrimidine kinase
MVGGLSESKYVQKSIQTAFPDINVLIPEDPELAVLKGKISPTSTYFMKQSAQNTCPFITTFFFSGCVPFLNGI